MSIQIIMLRLILSLKTLLWIWHKQEKGSGMQVFVCFEGTLNLAEIVFRNVYTFTESELPLLIGALNFRGNSNVTVSNITIQVFASFAHPTTMIRFLTSNDWILQDDVLQYFHVDNVYSTMPDNPARAMSGLIGWSTTPGSTRRYQYIIRDSLFDNRINDALCSFLIFGQFNEEVILSNSHSPTLKLQLNDLR